MDNLNNIGQKIDRQVIKYFFGAFRDGCCSTSCRTCEIRDLCNMDLTEIKPGHVDRICDWLERAQYDDAKTI